MKVRKYLIAFILLILCIPMVSKADTWLDDPSYRDTSWFDASTYDATLSYTIDTPEKLESEIKGEITFAKKVFLAFDDTGIGIINIKLFFLVMEITSKYYNILENHCNYLTSVLL